MLFRMLFHAVSLLALWHGEVFKAKLNFISNMLSENITSVHLCAFKSGIVRFCILQAYEHKLNVEHLVSLKRLKSAQTMR